MQSNFSLESISAGTIAYSVAAFWPSKTEKLKKKQQQQQNK
jgi:hypothetical protein